MVLFGMRHSNLLHDIPLLQRARPEIGTGMMRADNRCLYLSSKNYLASLLLTQRSARVALDQNSLD